MRIFVVLLDDKKEKVNNAEWFEMKDEDAEEIKEMLRRKGCLS